MFGLVGTRFSASDLIAGSSFAEAIGFASGAQKSSGYKSSNMLCSHTAC